MIGPGIHQGTHQGIGLRINRRTSSQHGQPIEANHNLVTVVTDILGFTEKTAQPDSLKALAQPKDQRALPDLEILASRLDGDDEQGSCHQSVPSEAIATPKRK